MATAKRITELTAYTSVLPYASELFGIYQPLLGWKAKRNAKRFKDEFVQDMPFILDKLKRQIADRIDIMYLPSGELDIQIRPGI